MRILSLAFFALVLGAAAWTLRGVDWTAVGQAIREYRASTLVLAAVLATLSCILYASFDLLSQRLVRHALPAPWVLAIAFTSYTLNLNLGPWIGSLAVRLRLYPKLGLRSTDVLRIVVLTTITNWQGYFALAGLALLVAPPPRLPDDWPIGPLALQLAGALMFVLSAAYLALCAFAADRTLAIRKLRVRVPRLPVALAQTAVASLNWVLIAAVPYVLLRGAVSYSTAMVALLVACAAGAIAHVPAGLGVIEAVLLAMLGRDVPTPHMIAGLLAYRAVYYLWPFLLGLATFAVTEFLIRRRRSAHAPGLPA